MTRTDVLDLLGQLISYRWRGLSRDDIPVHFWRDRVAVILPERAFSPDDCIRLDGQFQCLMTSRGEHGFLDFASNWQGIHTPVKQGFN
jgi:hypothetical protein